MRPLFGPGRRAALAGQTRAAVSAGPPHVTGISPSVGPLAGGTTVTVTGDSFVNGSGLTCTVGGEPLTGLTFVSSTSLTGTTAAHVAGYANVVVTNPDTQYGTLVGGFLYQGEDVATPVFADNFENQALGTCTTAQASGPKEPGYGWGGSQAGGGEVVWSDLAHNSTKALNPLWGFLGTANGTQMTVTAGYDSGSKVGKQVYVCDEDYQILGGLRTIVGQSTSNITAGTVITFDSDITGAIGFGNMVGEYGPAKQRDMSFGDFLPEFWVEYWWLPPAHYYHRTYPGLANNNKFLVLYPDEYSSADEGPYCLLQTWVAGSGSRIDTVAHSFLRHQQVYWNKTLEGADVAYAYNNFVSHYGPVKPGQWAQIRLHYKAASDPLQNDGEAHIWVDGRLVGRITGANFAPSGLAGVGSNGSFVRNSGTWNSFEIARKPGKTYHFYDATLNLVGTAVCTSANATTLYFTGDMSGAVWAVSQCGVHSGYIMGASNSGFDVPSQFGVDDWKLYADDPGWDRDTIQTPEPRSMLSGSAPSGTSHSYNFVLKSGLRRKLLVFVSAESGTVVFSNMKFNGISIGSPFETLVSNSVLTAEAYAYDVPDNLEPGIYQITYNTSVSLQPRLWAVHTCNSASGAVISDSGTFLPNDAAGPTLSLPDVGADSLVFAYGADTNATWGVDVWFSWPDVALSGRRLNGAAGDGEVGEFCGNNSSGTVYGGGSGGSPNHYALGACRVRLPAGDLEIAIARDPAYLSGSGLGIVCAVTFDGG